MPIGCHSYHSRTCVSHFSVSCLHYSTFLSIGTASDILEGKLDALGSRIGRLLFKLAVEQNMTANILASEINVGLDTMEKVRSRCVREVKQINGEIKFEDALKYQKGWD